MGNSSLVSTWLVILVTQGARRAEGYFKRKSVSECVILGALQVGAARVEWLHKVVTAGAVGVNAETLRHFFGRAGS